MIYLADTHALLWLVLDERRLGPAARTSIKAPDSQIFMATLSLSEINYSFNAGRIPVDSRAVLQRVEGAYNIEFVPLHEEVAHRLPRGLNIHDGIIVATGLYLQETIGEAVTLITTDGQIQRSGLIATIW